MLEKSEFDKEMIQTYSEKQLNWLLPTFIIVYNNYLVNNVYFYFFVVVEGMGG